MKIIIYAQGIMACSVCVPKEMAKQEIEEEVNLISPTGIESKWKISKDKFNTEEDNPHKCEKDPGKLHYLLNC